MFKTIMRVFILLTVISMLMAYHTIDTAWNMKEHEIDTSIFGVQRNRLEVYYFGLSAFFIGAFCLIIVSITSEIRDEPKVYI